MSYIEKAVLLVIGCLCLLLLWLRYKAVYDTIINDIASPKCGVIVPKILAVEDKPNKFGLGQLISEVFSERKKNIDNKFNYLYNRYFLSKNSS